MPWLISQVRWVPVGERGLRLNGGSVVLEGKGSPGFFPLLRSGSSLG